MKVEDFKIIGITVRTSNKKNLSFQDIGNLWEQFYANNLFEKIPNKVNYNIYSIYTDYKSDFTDDFTVIIGMSVKSLDVVPDGQ
jgi:predicted transcriptional regulator YdeE